MSKKFVLCRKRKCSVRITCPNTKKYFQPSKSISLENCAKCEYYHGTETTVIKHTQKTRWEFLEITVLCAFYKVNEEVVKVDL